MITILLADDHRLVRESVRKLLSTEADFKVVGEAEDGVQAVKLAHALKPDILLTDLRMPGVDGIEVTMQVKKSSPQTGVIVLSRYSEEAYVYAALRAGAGGYVLKQSSPEELLRAIRAVANGDRFLSPPLSEASIEAYRQKTDKPPLGGADPQKLSTLPWSSPASCL